MVLELNDRGVVAILKSFEIFYIVWLWRLNEIMDLDKFEPFAQA